MLLNYTAQDIFSLLLAILLFTTVLLFPGYVIGWATNLFSFRQRTFPAQYVIAIALSNALMPILLFLAFRFISNQFGIGIIITFLLLWLAIQIRSGTKSRPRLEFTRELKWALAIGGVWVAFCVFLLVDIQVGQRLYNNAASYDFASRTALIEAITRTGIPPVNPSYYPGHFERITELYYFWYILGSVVDTLGGKWVDARLALFAGIVWGGLSLMATIALYLRLRNPQSGRKAWHTSILGAQLLAISGLDFVPVMTIMIMAKTSLGTLPFDGRVEGWNLPVMSWLNAMTWVPNHVTGLIACIIAMLAILSSYRTPTSRWVLYVILAGASIASAFGLSLWIPFTFGVFMAIWAISLLFQKSQRALFFAIVAAGILGLIAASPFLADILKSGGKSEMTGALPISLYVRRFSFTGALAPGAREIFGILLLPVNYFFELGFFFVIAVLWIRQSRKSEHWRSNPFWRAEILLLGVVTILLSFVKSTVIALNDLGIRGWLLGQFVLIVWAVDIFNAAPKDQFLLTSSIFNSPSNSRRLNDLLAISLIIGMMTTTLEATSTRFWTVLIDAGVTGVPNELTLDTNLGERTYDARLAYEYIRDHTPPDSIIQNNPTVLLDRPAGLYGTRQLVIADRTAYGVPVEVFRKMTTSIGRIFLAESVLDWVSTDQICRQYSIQVIVINDTDPLWSSLAVLKEQRSPLYINPRYAVFSCGKQKE